MTGVIDANGPMENLTIRVRAMGHTVQCLAEAIDHDPRLAAALDGVGEVICEAMDELDDLRACLRVGMKQAVTD